MNTSKQNCMKFTKLKNAQIIRLLLKVHFSLHRVQEGREVLRAWSWSQIILAFLNLVNFKQLCQQEKKMLGRYVFSGALTKYWTVFLIHFRN